MIKRFSILSLLLVLFAGTSIHGTPARPAPDHAQIVHSQSTSQTSAADAQRHFGLIPIEHQAEKEAPASQEYHNTSSTDDTPGHEGSHKNNDLIGHGAVTSGYAAAVVIAIDRTTKILFPFHSFL